MSGRDTERFSTAHRIKKKHKRCMILIFTERHYQQIFKYLISFINERHILFVLRGMGYLTYISDKQDESI